MAAYSRLQQAEFAAEKHGYTATKHQREVGTGYFDEVMKVVSREHSPPPPPPKPTPSRPGTNKKENKKEDTPPELAEKNDETTTQPPAGRGLRDDAAG